jgi:hypothetical protein
MHHGGCCSRRARRLRGGGGALRQADGQVAAPDHPSAGLSGAAAEGPPAGHSPGVGPRIGVGAPLGRAVLAAGDKGPGGVVELAWHRVLRLSQLYHPAVTYCMQAWRGRVLCQSAPARWGSCEGERAELQSQLRSAAVAAVPAALLQVLPCAAGPARAVLVRSWGSARHA